MKADDFEQKLQRQELKPVPAAWREEILSAARAAAPRPSTLISRPALWWRDLLWPCPQAWAGLAAAWLVVLALNFMTGAEPRVAARRDSSPPSAEEQAVLREQRKLLVELAGLPEAGVAARPKSHPFKPRSETWNPIKAA